MRTILLIMMALAFSTPPALVAKERTTLLGTWRLVSAKASISSGERIEAPFGKNPQGILTYTSDGRMSVMISHGERRPLSGDRISAPDEEKVEAYSTFFAYAGRYSVEGNKVIHHVEISSVENWVNTDLNRLIKFQGPRIRLITPPLSVGTKVQTTDLLWERVRESK